MSISIRAASCGRSVLVMCVFALAALAPRLTNAGPCEVVTGTVNHELLFNKNGKCVLVKPHAVVSGTDGIDIEGKNGRVLVHKGALVRGSDDGIEINHGRVDVWGSVKGNDAGIEIDGHGDLVTEIYIYKSGSVKSKINDGISLDNDTTAKIVNHGVVEGRDDGVDDFRGWLFNYGLIQAGDEGVVIEGDADVWNSGFIIGAMNGSGNGDGIDIQNDLRNKVFIFNSPYGVIKSRSQEGIEISPGAGETYLTNWGLVRGQTHGIFHGLEDDDNDLGPARALRVWNYGIIQGKNGNAISSFPGARVIVGGTGLFDGGVRVTNQNGQLQQGGRLSVVDFNVTKEVLASLGESGGANTNGGSFSFGRRLAAEGWDEVSWDGLYSFEVLAASDMAEAGGSLDNSVITRLGADLHFLGNMGMIHEDKDQFARVLETFSGRAIAHTWSDIAFTSDTFLGNKLADYLNQHADRRAWRPADAEPDPRFTTWIRGIGSQGDQDRTSTRLETDWNEYGFIAGIDAQVGERGRVGPFLAYRREDATIDEWSDYNGDNPSVGFYGSYGCDCGAFFSSAAWYTSREYQGNRALIVPTGDPATDFFSSSDYDTRGNQFTWLGRAAWDYRRPALGGNIVASPFWTLQFSGLWIDSYDESGGGLLDLSVASQTAYSLRSMLGARIGGEWEVGNFATLRPDIRIEWIHEMLNDGRDIWVMPASPFFDRFNVESDVGNRNFAKFGTGVTASLNRCECVDVNFSYDNIFAVDGLTTWDVGFDVRYRF